MGLGREFGVGWFEFSLLTAGVPAGSGENGSHSSVCHDGGGSVVDGRTEGVFMAFDAELPFMGDFDRARGPVEAEIAACVGVFAVLLSLS